MSAASVYLPYKGSYKTIKGLSQKAGIEDMPQRH